MSRTRCSTRRPSNSLYMYELELFEPVAVGARSCDSKRSSLLLHRWAWSRQLERIFTQPCNSTHNTDSIKRDCV